MQSLFEGYLGGVLQVVKFVPFIMEADQEAAQEERDILSQHRIFFLTSRTSKPNGISEIIVFCSLFRETTN